MLIHKHLVMSAELSSPIKSEEDAIRFMKDLVDEIGMKIAAGPIANYVEIEGNRGITGSVCIQTSHIAFHIWDEQFPARMEMDVYSCADFDLMSVLRFIDAHMGIVNIKTQFVKRGL